MYPATKTVQGGPPGKGEEQFPGGRGRLGGDSPGEGSITMELRLGKHEALEGS